METVLVDRLNETINRVAATEKTRHKALAWMRKVKDALDSSNWLMFIELTREQQVRAIADTGILPSADLENLRLKSSSHVLDAQIEFFKELNGLCEEGGLVPGVLGSTSRDIRLRGMLTISLDAQRGLVHLATLARKKRLATLVPKQTYNVAAEWWKVIWRRPFEGQDFLNRLYKAYARRARHGEDVQLGDVQRYVWEDMQPRSFWEKYNLDLATGYTTDEFSADISRLLLSGVNRTSDNLRMHLSAHGGGIPVFDQRGECSIYKFIRFDPD